MKLLRLRSLTIRSLLKKIPEAYRNITCCGLWCKKKAKNSGIYPGNNNSFEKVVLDQDATQFK